MKYLYPKNLKSKANACLMEKLFLGQYIVWSCASSAQDVYKKRKCKIKNANVKNAIKKPKNAIYFFFIIM